MKRHFALALLFCATALAIEPEPIPRSLGVNIHFTDPKPGEMEMIRAGGFHVIRMDMAWSTIEKTPGVYDFAHYDRLVSALEAQQLRAMFILDYNNFFYDNNVSPHTDAGRAAFAKWATACVKRYAGKSYLWEIWNEPNHAGFWKPSPKVADYVALASETAKAIRAAAPGEIIVGPATSTVDLPFLEACFKGGLLEHFDAVTVHPYLWGDPEGVTDLYRKLRQLILRYAPADKRVPILSGEWGYTTARDDIDAERQGKLLARQWLTNLACDIPVSIWYDWRDDGTNPKDNEHNFGTVEHTLLGGVAAPYRAKPAYIAAQTLTRQLDGHRFNKRLALERDSEWLLLFERDGKFTVVAWTTSRQPRPVTLPLLGRFGLTSHLGEPLGEREATGDGLRLELTDGPVYLVPVGENPWLTTLGEWRRLRDADAVQAPSRHPSGLFVPRTQHPIRLERELRVPGRPTARQHAILTVANPLVVQVLPPMQGQLPITIENPTEQPTRGEVQLVDERQALDLAPFAKTTLRFTAPLGSAAPRIVSGETLLAASTPQRFVPISTDALSAIRDGDPAVASEVALKPAAARDGLPVAGVDALQLDYEFAAGWKFARIAPPAPLTIDGQPIALGVWVHGDGSGNLARMRYADATGQTLQPHGFALDFTGWRYLEFPLRGEAAGHWGGANDGIVHYPIRLDTLLLIDSAKRQETSGSIQMTHPVLIYPAR